MGSSQRAGCVVFVSPHPYVHLAQLGDSKRADNSECLSYSVGSEIGNRRPPPRTPALSRTRLGASYIMGPSGPLWHVRIKPTLWRRTWRPPWRFTRARRGLGEVVARAACGEFVLCAPGGTIDTSVCGGIGVRGSDRGLGADPFAPVYLGRRDRVASLASRPARLRYSTDTAHDRDPFRVREGELHRRSTRIPRTVPAGRGSWTGDVSCAHR